MVLIIYEDFEILHRESCWQKQSQNLWATDLDNEIFRELPGGTAMPGSGWHCRDQELP